MQIVKVTAGFIFSAACTKEMLFELAQSPLVGYDLPATERLASEQLKKGTAQMKAMPYGKLRTIIVNKLQNNGDINEVFASADGMEFEFQCLADEQDMSKAGANKAKRNTGAGSANRAGKQDLTGAYHVVKQGVKCSPETDAGKWEIWQHVWACNSFEEYFQKAPAKAVTKTGRVITARSELLWAIKSKWIVAGEKAAA